VRSVIKNTKYLISPHLRDNKSKIDETNSHIWLLDMRLEKAEGIIPWMPLKDRKAQHSAKQPQSISKGIDKIRNNFRPAATFTA